MTIVISPRAFRDLADLEAYLSDRSPRGYANVAIAIRRSLSLIEERPLVGRSARRRHVRTLVEPRYGYVITYKITADEIWIVRVHHPKRLRPQTSDV